MPYVSARLGRRTLGGRLAFKPVGTNSVAGFTALAVVVELDCAPLIQEAGGSLFAVVGIAAFVGCAYKVPLAGVAFVAETTGAPGYVIPGLLAAALGYLVSGRWSISEHQRFRRAGG